MSGYFSHGYAEGSLCIGVCTGASASLSKHRCSERDAIKALIHAPSRVATALKGLQDGN